MTSLSPFVTISRHEMVKDCVFQANIMRPPPRTSAHLVPREHQNTAFFCIDRIYIYPRNVLPCGAMPRMSALIKIAIVDHSPSIFSLTNISLSLLYDPKCSLDIVDIMRYGYYVKRFLLTCYFHDILPSTTKSWFFIMTTDVSSLINIIY